MPNGKGPVNQFQDKTVSDALVNVAVILDQEKDPYGEVLVDTAEKMGRHLAINRKMTTAQIRKLYSEVKRINFKEKGPYRINVMRAKLAYTAGRYEPVKDLQAVLDSALKGIGTSEQKYRRFVDFFEAIVAYHKKYGGRD